MVDHRPRGLQAEVHGPTAHTPQIPPPSCVGGGGVTPPTHPSRTPPPQVIGQTFLWVFGQSKFFCGAFSASQFRPKNFFGAFSASNNSAPPPPLI